MKRKVIIGIVMLILLAVMTGCGAKTSGGENVGQEIGGVESTVQESDSTQAQEVTAEQFIAKMIAAADGAVVTKVDSKALLQAIVGDNNNYIVIDNLYTSHNEYDKESVASRAEIVLENQNGSFNMVYNLVEEQGVLYYYANSGDNWVKYEALLDKEDLSRNFVSNMNLENAEILGFETEGVQYNGQDVYKLSVKLKDANIHELVFESGMKHLFWAKEYATIDLSDIIVTAVYYVDPQSARVLKVEANLEGMKNVLTEWGIYNWSTYFGHVLDIVELHECKLLYENISYEDYTLPKLSFEDKKKSLLVHQKDATYSLSVLDAEVEVICPAGWYVEEKAEDYLLLFGSWIYNGRSFRRLAITWGRQNRK